MSLVKVRSAWARVGPTANDCCIAIEKQINWDEVSVVYFSQDPWYGTKSCRIFFNKEQPHEPREKDKCDFVLPISSVDEQKLQQLIPNYLWKNNPHWI